MYEKGLFWFRRDLRLHDNAALYKALKSAKSLDYVFVFDPNILNKLQDKDDRRVTYIWRSVEELRKLLQNKGAHLFVLYGDPVELLPKLAARLGANCVFANRDYESYALKRDDLVQAKLNQEQVHFSTCKDQIIFEATEVTKSDGKPYTVFTPYKKAWWKKLETDLPFFLGSYPSLKYLESSQTSSFEELLKLKPFLENDGLLEVNSLEQMGFIEAKDLIVPSGVSGAQKQLNDFLQNGLLKYKVQRDFLKPQLTSNLSVHLRFGTVSIRECFSQAYALLLANPADAQIKDNVDGWLSELIWREFYSMILQAFPIVEQAAFKPEYRNLLWRVDEKLLKAWQDGMTGYPIVDAAMRQLKQTGQMYNRARMITASFLVKDLLLDWKRGEEHFARYLLDFDLASNNGGWQWASSTGTDAAPYFRVFNPSIQSEKFDPEAEYIKHYVPELKSVPAGKIHKLQFEVKNYPKPIVRHEEAKEAVLSLFKAVKSRTKD